jgi:hypothetical protein
MEQIIPAAQDVVWQVRELLGHPLLQIRTNLRLLHATSLRFVPVVRGWSDLNPLSHASDLESALKENEASRTFRFREDLFYC